MASTRCRLTCQYEVAGRGVSPRYEVLFQVAAGQSGRDTWHLAYVSTSGRFLVAGGSSPRAFQVTVNEDYYHEQNSCYDSNSFGFDQTQPPQYTIHHPIFNVQNDLLNSQNKLMEKMTSICDMVGQIIQKKEEERRIAEDQAAKDRFWNDSYLAMM
ncbi:hypothetical protein Tco_0260521 [Tanacetum coccineum]